MSENEIVRWIRSRWPQAADVWSASPKVAALVRLFGEAPSREHLDLLALPLADASGRLRSALTDDELTLLRSEYRKARARLTA